MGTKELLQEAPEIQLPNPPFGDQLPLPPKHPEAPMLPPQMLPEGIRQWLVDAAARACLPLEMLAVPAIVALSGLIGRSVCIKPREYSDWTVIPNLWGAIVAPPGSKKSDATDEATRPLKALEAKSRAEHKAAQLEAKAEQAMLKAQLSGLANKAKKNTASKGDFTELLGKLEALEEVPERRYTTTDVTAEKLGELLRDNPRGLTVVRDELASWIASMESQENAVARGFFLSAWNGSSGYTFDRIGRGTTHIPAACVSIVGSIQPQPLQATFDRLRRDPTRADGMLQRFQLLVWPDSMPDWVAPTEWPNSDAREQAFEVFAKLDSLEFRAPDSDELQPLTLRFTSEAGQAFAQWHDEHENRIRRSELDGSPHFKGHVGKYGSLAASLAVVFHLVGFAASSTHWAFSDGHWAMLGDVSPVSLEATHLALDWVEFLELHARKVYAPELNGGILAAHDLAQQIERGDVGDGQTIRELQRSSRAWSDRDRLEEALHTLERLGWLKVVEHRDGARGRLSELIRLHPELREGKR